jgi:YggT family protein
LLVNLFTLVIVVNVLFSWILPPYHQARIMLDRLLLPILNPIRRLLPPMGGIDFSPMILLFAIQILGNLLISLVAQL